MQAAFCFPGNVHHVPGSAENKPVKVEREPEEFCTTESSATCKCLSRKRAASSHFPFQDTFHATVIYMPGHGVEKKSKKYTMWLSVIFRAAFKKSSSLSKLKQGIALMENGKPNAVFHTWEWVCVHEQCTSHFSTVSVHLSTCNWGKEIKELLFFPLVS